MTADLPATEPEIGLDDEIDREARRCAVLQWANLPPTRAAVVSFDQLVERHRERLARKHGLSGP